MVADQPKASGPWSLAEGEEGAGREYDPCHATLRAQRRFECSKPLRRFCGHVQRFTRVGESGLGAWGLGLGFRV